jgi:hypothetical protein
MVFNILPQLASSEPSGQFAEPLQREDPGIHILKSKQ